MSKKQSLKERNDMYGLPLEHMQLCKERNELFRQISQINVRLAEIEDILKLHNKPDYEQTTKILDKVKK